MGFFSKFEGRMEDTFEGAANKMFDAPISPVQIAKKAEKVMRREKMVGAGKQYAPTLYTVLVNENDDQRLFGYYPTLAGETETYLTSKAASEGLVMDGQPLVRFIVDENLKHGKFDIIAEPVAAPIIAQLRAEEMQRYGLGGGAVAPAYQQAPQQPYNDPYAAPQPQPPSAFPQPQSWNDPYGTPQQAPYPANVQPQSEYDLVERNPYAENQHDFFNQPAAKPPLPYVPDEELDYSIDYGKYTFDSQDFDDYRENGASGRPLAENDTYEQNSHDYQNAPSAPFNAAGYAANSAVGGAMQAAEYAAGAGAIGAAAGYVGAGVRHAAAHHTPEQAATPAGAPDTVVFAAGSGNAAPTPNTNLVRARLINLNENRAYDLAATRFVLGRDHKNTIVVDDINASRQHAELRFEPQGVWVIVDLGSTNGTFVNGAEITSRPLREGDRITIGMTSFAFTQS